MSGVLHASVMERLAHMFDVPVIQNNLRGIYIELMVSELLGDTWHHAGMDWAAYDFEHEDGTRLEVKQSAARQTWSISSEPSKRHSFNIRTAKMEWVGKVSLALTERPAQIYVFAWHGDCTTKADHRDAGQWEFFVVPTSILPLQNSISLSAIKKLADPVRFDLLGQTVAKMLRKGPIQ